jgi:hypothetical protein
VVETSSPSGPDAAGRYQLCAGERNSGIIHPGWTGAIHIYPGLLSDQTAICHTIPSPAAHMTALCPSPHIS